MLTITRDDQNDQLVLTTADRIAKTFNGKTENISLSPNDVLDIDSIVEQSENFDLIIMGSVDFKLKHILKASDDEKIMQRALCSVFAIHKSTTLDDF